MHKLIIPETVFTMRGYTKLAAYICLLHEIPIKSLMKCTADLGLARIAIGLIVFDIDTNETLPSQSITLPSQSVILIFADLVASFFARNKMI
jgi:hypothetical protein